MDNRQIVLEQIPQGKLTPDHFRMQTTPAPAQPEATGAPALEQPGAPAQQPAATADQPGPVSR